MVKSLSLSVLLQLGKAYGIESYVLSPAETKDLYPLMNVSDLYGTLYVPKDGTMDPAGTCTTLTRAASARGATVMCTDLLLAWSKSFKITSTVHIITTLHEESTWDESVTMSATHSALL